MARLAEWPPPRKLCLGSGAAPIEGWMNVDLAGGADVRLDLRFGLPLPDGSVERIYSEHAIEHFTLEEGQSLLRECRRVLRPGGVLRVATPDLSAVFRAYEQASWQRQSHPHWPDLDQIDSAVRFVNCAFHSWGHQYLYDFDELARRLRAAGFSTIRRCVIGESEHADLRLLETRPESDLIVEATVLSP